MTSVTIPDSVTSIGSSAFRDCSGLTSVTIPDTVTSISSSAFRGCSGLTSVTIPDSVTSIGSDAFEDCSKLENIYITDIAAWCKISGIDNLMRYGSSNKKLYLNNELLTNLVIPDSVTSIDSWAFKGCSGLTSVTIPDSVTSIGSFAFNGCSKLENIYITDIAAWFKISGIGNLMGYGSSDKKLYLNNELLTNLVIPDSVTSIGSSAFSGCSGLTSVTIPNSVTSIGYCAFKDCDKLENIYITDIAAWCKISGIDNLMRYGSSNKKLYLNNELLTELVIPDSVTSIGWCAFYGCSGLTSITIGSGVTSIGSSAFDGCYKMVEVINNSSLSITKGSSSNGYVAYYALNVKKGGSSEVVNKDGYLFYTCDGVNYLFGYVGTETELTLPKNYNGQNYQIYEYAFDGCSGLTSVTIGSGVTLIGSSAFSGCSGLTSIEVAAGNTKYHSQGNCLIETAGKTLILGCQNSVIPADGSVTSIGFCAFYNCSGLTSVTIPDSVTSIDSHAFYNCSGLTSIIIPDSVTSIGSSAFEGCSSLKYNEYGNALYLGNKSNPYVALITAKTTDITSCNINEKCKVISSYAFSGCSGLTSITIPDSVTTIGVLAFYNCSGLTSVTIPDSVTSIDSHAFYNCSGLTSVTYKGTTAQWNAISKGNNWNYNTGNYTIHCTDGDISK